MPLNIDIGSSAIDRALYWISYEVTRVVKGNPANYSGKITKVYIYAHSAMTGVEVATFFVVSGSNLSTRDTANIGNVPIGYSEHVVDLTVKVGDYLGMHYLTGEIELTGTGQGEAGVWKLTSDAIPCVNTTFSLQADCTMSLYGTGTTIAPTVTSQAVTGIDHEKGTGNGNITDTGGENATKRGFCWNITGSPTIADDTVEEEGSFGTGAFTGAITGLDPGVKYYVKAYAYNSSGYSYGNEVNFTTDKVAPTVTCQASTDLLPTTVTVNGNITALGGENANRRGFEYGLTKNDPLEVHDDGSFGTGAYTKGLVSLSANTTYWIRAYARNSIGTSHSEWTTFQTAAVGTIPTGTLINICSDYSAYTYKLQRSETDDGEAYTGYFTINTDLAEKKGLTIYKRILDLHLYFRCEASGTAEIYAKRDSEASFQYLGSVDLTDVAEPTIIVKHLAVDVRAKDYDFKVSFGNACKFLGVVFEFIPGGER